MFTIKLRVPPKVFKIKNVTCWINIFDYLMIVDNLGFSRIFKSLRTPDIYTIFMQYTLAQNMRINAYIVVYIPPALLIL